MNLSWEKNEIADGLAISADNGKTWNITASSIFNFHANGILGLSTSIGMLDQFLVCQSSDGAVAMKISSSAVNSLIQDLETAVKKLK